MLVTTWRAQGEKGKEKGGKNRKKRFVLFSDCKRSLPRQQPGARRAQGRKSDAGTHPDRRDAHADDNALLGESGEVGGQAEVAAVVGQQHTVAHGAQRLDALNEGLLLNAAVSVCPVQQVPTLQPYRAFS